MYSKSLIESWKCKLLLALNIDYVAGEREKRPNEASLLRRASRNEEWRETTEAYASIIVDTRESWVVTRKWKLVLLNCTFKFVKINVSIYQLKLNSNLLLPILVLPALLRCNWILAHLWMLKSKMIW